MSDAGRKGVGQQVQEKVTPDSQKSAVDRVAETATGALDKGVAAVQPQDTKSTTQKLSDSTRGNADSAQGEGKSFLQSAQDTASSVYNSATDTLNSAGKKTEEKTS